MQNVEIERKWLLDTFPDLPALCDVQTEQGYLSFDPSTVRIRKRSEEDKASYRLTIKGPGTLCRTEVELPLERAQYEALRLLVLAPMVTKLFRTYRLPDGHVLECSLVDPGADTAFYYAEVEFDSEEKARSFRPPAFLGREVTDDPSFTMAAYCRRKAEMEPTD